jgi:PIN domain nuclease of toxin-antitoxin system
MRLLLDTCALLWMSASPGSLSAAAQAAMSTPDSELYFSSISALEIGIKCRNRKLVLPEPIASWFPKTVARLELREVSLQSTIAIKAASMDWDHRDPADRILVATALTMDMMIVTSDAAIDSFVPARVIW